MEDQTDLNVVIGFPFYLGVLLDKPLSFSLLLQREREGDVQECCDPGNCCRGAPVTVSFWKSNLPAECNFDRRVAGQSVSQSLF